MNYVLNYDGQPSKKIEQSEWGDSVVTELGDYVQVVHAFFYRCKLFVGAAGANDFNALIDLSWLG